MDHVLFRNRFSPLTGEFNRKTQMKSILERANADIAKANLQKVSPVTNAGTYNYQCLLHDGSGMKGTLTVAPVP